MTMTTLPTTGRRLPTAPWETETDDEIRARALAALEEATKHVRRRGCDYMARPIIADVLDMLNTLNVRTIRAREETRRSLAAAAWPRGASFGTTAGPVPPGLAAQRDQIGTARRVTKSQARAHFQRGGSVLVSERGHEPTQKVTADTTTHNQTTTSWDELVASVEMWANRYPNQRFYVID